LMSSKNILLVVVDGISDRPVGGKTPLDSASTPNLDFFAKSGINGIMDTISPGIRPGSDTSHFALLGYDPFRYYSGRGPIEAAGAGIRIKPGDLAFRVNFGTVENSKSGGSVFDKVVVDRRAGRISDTDELVKAISEGLNLEEFGVEFTLKRGSGHRGALVFRGEGLSDRITDTDPKKIGEKVRRCKPLDESDGAKKTAEIINYFMERSHEILENHPYNAEREKKGLLKGNVLLLRGAGIVKKIVPFNEKSGLKLAVIAGTTLIKGIANFVGADLIDVAGATGNLRTNLEGKLRAAIKALETHDIVLLHIKATDELGHDGDFEGKKKFIEHLDDKLALLKELDFTKTCLIVTADHSTPVTVKEHTADPVPVTIVYEGVRVDQVERFSEFEAYKGGLCRIRGMDLLNIALDLIDKSKKFGA